VLVVVVTGLDVVVAEEVLVMVLVLVLVGSMHLPPRPVPKPQ